MERKEILKSDLILLTTALIWGMAFVAQKKGMEFIGPFTFNAIRFALGAAVILPLIPFLKDKRSKPIKTKSNKLTLLSGGIISGIALFLGSSFQQTGIVYTTAGNAGFITSLYVILTPILGLAIKQKPPAKVWTGAVLATVGLYLLSVNRNFHISGGDMLVFASAFFYAIHVLLIGFLSPLYNNYKLAFIQFLATSLLSLVIALFFETTDWQSVLNAGIPILYAGVLSTAVAFTLQIIGQRKTIPSHAAILLSFESVFALIGGWILLNEESTTRQITGCLLMFAGILAAQIKLKRKTN